MRILGENSWKTSRRGFARFSRTRFISARRWFSASRTLANLEGLPRRTFSAKSSSRRQAQFYVRTLRTVTADTRRLYIISFRMLYTSACARQGLRLAGSERLVRPVNLLYVQFHVFSILNKFSTGRWPAPSRTENQISRVTRFRRGFCRSFSRNVAISSCGLPTAKYYFFSYIKVIRFSSTELW